MNHELSKLHYAQWLEAALQELIKFPIKGICIAATTTRGDIYTNYYQIPMSDKLTISGFIQQDAMLDTLTVNGFIERDDGTATDEN